LGSASIRANHKRWSNRRRGLGRAETNSTPVYAGRCLAVTRCPVILHGYYYAYNILIILHIYLHTACRGSANPNTLYVMKIKQQNNDFSKDRV
jgi:hypothetical protein